MGKYFTYDFHYNFIKNDVDAELLFTDRDSLTYEIKSEDVYEDFYKNEHLFDICNYPKDSKILHPVNEKVIRKMKDLHEGKPIRNFAGIKSKMHSTLLDDSKEFNTAKWVNVAMKFNEYKDIYSTKK